MVLTAGSSLDDVPSPDIIVIPGSGKVPFLEDPAAVEWVRRARETSRWTTSVRTGSMLLGAAGILQGKRATSHWAVRDYLRNFGAEPVAERVVVEGKVITAGGVSAGIDMALTLAAREAGEDEARALQLVIEYDPSHPSTRDRWKGRTADQAARNRSARRRRGVSRRVGHGRCHPTAVDLTRAPTHHRRRSLSGPGPEGQMVATQEQKTVAFVLYPGLTLLDLVGPLQVFASLRQFNDQYRPVVVAERLEPMATDGPLTVIADRTFGEVPDPAVVLVPGGGAPTIKAMGDPAIREYLRQAADTAPVVGSACTGALVLAAAGLLEGRQATTHWAYHRLLERLGATYLPKRWVEDGKFATSAGVSAGIDLALALVARLTDEPTARMVQLAIEYDPHPPFGGIDWGQVDRDIYEPILGPMLQQQLADRPELFARLSG